MKLKKRNVSIVLVLILIMSMLVACSKNEEVKEKAEVKEEIVEEKEDSKEETKDIPTLGIGYMFSNHQAPLIIAAAKNEDFKDKGIYLKEIVEKEKYIMMEDEKEIANIDIVVAENGGEVMTMMTQDHLQMGLSSIGLPLTNIDEGGEMKVLGPIHVDGIGLVMPKDSDVNNFDDFIEFVKNKDESVKIGYHSPANAPVILFESAIKEMGLKITEDPTDTSSDILLINLKGTANLIPALNSGEVDAWVGPSPFPELAEVEEAGKIILDMRDLPPSGKWHDFPCCVFSATDKAIAENPVEIEKFFELLTIASNFANDEKEESAKIIADWMGVSEEAAKRTTTKYSTEPNESWFNNVNVTYESLKNSDKFNGELKDKTLEEVKDKVFNMDFANKIFK